MLVLSRKLGQFVQVGDDVRITVVRIDRNAVRIGIEAPDGVAIYREEILDETRVGRNTPSETTAKLGMAG